PPPCSTLFPYTTLFRSVSWASSAKHYSIPVGADPHAWLRSHRRAELESDVSRGHCERVASRWFGTLEKSADPWSRASYVAILSRSEEHTSELQSRFDLV